MFVFLSYQRADTLFAAHALYYALRHGGHEAFVDTGSIGMGDVFPEEIGNALARTNVMLSLIGRRFKVKRLHDTGNVISYEWRRAMFHSCSVVPVLVDGGKMPSSSDLPAELRWFAKRSAESLANASLSRDIHALVDKIALLATKPRQAARVLWVDDKPANNESERKELRPHGIVFDNVVSTAEAIEQLKQHTTYDLIITDLGREHSSDRSRVAGKELLRDPVVKNGGPPVFIYASKWALQQRDELLALGAAEVMVERPKLINSVLSTLGRTSEKPNLSSR